MLDAGEKEAAPLMTGDESGRSVGTGASGTPLRLLLIEDSDDDADLIHRALERGGYSVSSRRVQTRLELDDALTETWDIVISDHGLPGFDARAALAALRATGRDDPFIVVSGAIGEDVAVEMMRAGATDYVMKSSLARLPTAVARELRDAATRRARREAEAALHRSEEQLRQAQKMEAIGRLAGGIAHDFNNLLMAIMGSSELALRRLRPADPARDDVEEILRTAQRAGILTRQLLAFSRRQIVKPRVLELGRVVRDIDRMLRRVIGEDVELVTPPEGTRDPVRADPGQIEQIVMNLAVNARDAMPGGGRLEIRTEDVTLDAQTARAYVGGRPGRFVTLVVSDTGTGMTDDVRAHLFEPFFTTKPPGRGTGLGLSTVYGIVQQAGGAIAVDTAPGKGTTMRILLPRSDEPPDSSVRLVPPAAVPARGTGTVLVVEDDPILRRLTRRLLEDTGYVVLEASRGDEALAIAGQPVPIDAVVTDVVLPGLGGREVVARLTEARPGLRVVFMSGYTDSDLVDLSALGPGVSLLQKPFSADQLTSALRDAPVR
jgi:signal transduction histidine kinase